MAPYQLVRTTLLVVIALFFTVLGCAHAPHPLLRAFAPENIVETVTASSTLDARAAVNVRLPFVPASHVIAETRGDRVYVKLRPPFNTAEFARYYREELAKRGHSNVTVVTEEDR